MYITRGLRGTAEENIAAAIAASGGSAGGATGTKKIIVEKLTAAIMAKITPYIDGVVKNATGYDVSNCSQYDFVTKQLCKTAKTGV